MPEPRITFESIDLLDAIERRGSFAKAAEELGKATSAVSYGVQKLEEQLGITVFVRQGRRSVLTPAGRLLLEEGRTILSATARLAERTRELASGWELRIRISVESTFDQTRLFDAFAQFQAQHPEIELDISESLLSGSWEALEQGRVELLIGAVAPVPSHRGFRTLAIGHADLVPVISAHHSDAALVATGHGDANVRRIITRDTATLEVPRSAGLKVENNQVLYVQTMAQKVAAIKAGLGAGHVPRHHIGPELERGELLTLPITASKPRQYLAWHSTNHGRGLQALTRIIEELN